MAERIVEFQRLSSDVSNQERWFLLGLLTELERAGMQIASGECFGLKKPPALGGRIELSNMEIAPLYVYVSLMSKICRQVQGLPAGTRISGFKVE